MQLKQRDAHTFSSRLNDYVEFKEMAEMKNGVEFQMASNRITT